jgi:hypothetical protein
MASVFRGVLDFFNLIGIYDVVLPFLLVFTIVFAILEKTRVLGVDEVDGKKFTKKNLNSMVAFVIAFFVIASSQLVEIITQVSSQIVILLLLSVFFLLLVGSFYGYNEEPFSLSDSWKLIFTIIMFIGIVAIFLMAIKTEDGTPWLVWIANFIYENASGALVGSIILMLIIIGFMYWVVKEPSDNSKNESG